ncbi:MAG: hypothetical protein IT542_00455 [Rubellimicrobium sp.]|nr:hypothetical protein [Rubellimicrobium sp.]
MWRHVFLTVFLSVSALSLTACGDGNPFDPPDDGGGGGGGSGGGGDDAAGGDNPDGGGQTHNPILDTGTQRPTGGSTPTPSDGSITRLEAANDSGGGLVSSVTYNARRDRFIVDGLGFDGANTYSRGDPVGSLGGATQTYAVYEADITVDDMLTGNPIGQIAPYRAIYGVSRNNTSATDARPRSSFAIVRTGGYVDYGFGGFLYARNGGVTLPQGPFGPDSSAQAVFVGDYAGMRVFAGQGGLEYTTGRVQVSIDFRDFNSGAAVRGTISDRQAFTGDGAEILPGTNLDDHRILLPDVGFVVTAGGPVLMPNGELAGNVASHVRDGSGNLVPYESGTYYAVIAGDMTDRNDGGEIVGIVVMTSEDPRVDGVTAQETGGFIVYR